MTAIPVSRPVSGAARLIGRAWRAATWKHFAVTSLLALAWSLAVLASLSGFFTRALPAAPVANAILSMQFSATTVMVALLLADATCVRASWRWAPYAVAAVAGVAVGTHLMWLVSQQWIGIGTAYMAGQSSEGYPTFIYRHGIHGLVVCGLAAYVYAARRMAARRLEALRAVQRQRSTAEKRVVESRLAATQARVDPDFLARTLARIQALHVQDAEAADRMLADLVTYLRCAIPSTDDPATTLSRELQLAKAYLNLNSPRAGPWIVHRALIGEPVQAARFPHMVLLPLLHHAVAHRSPGVAEAFGLDGTIEGADLVVTLRDPGHGLVERDGEMLRQLRARLHALHGGQARLDLSAGGSEARLVIPRE